ncbi:acetylcholine receptor subunit alpha-like [Ruditapes philippinarum]|uniref:acetylcholine receptor subunit alpha-like n=1 Tax=Ruditapes philippinarum TaxID=129788 RepID=UPI00295AA77A|nr:acetylcholine receptor subunit alpha-like [Ruditapes philippinarum]
MDYKLLIVTFLLFQLEYIHCSNITQVEGLYTNLFKNYNKKLFPLINHNNSMEINVTIGIISINNFDELSGEIEITMYFNFQWIDENLIWTPSQYGGKSVLLVASEDIWRPQLYLLQSYDTLQEITNVSLMARLFSNGLVMWNIGSVLKIVCSVDVTYFPFDTQTCLLMVSGWAYTNDEVLLIVNSAKVNEDSFSNNSQWILQSATSQNNYDIISSFPPTIFVILKLQRRSDFFVVYIIFPMVFLGLINNLVFVMPVNSGERTSVAITTFLSFIVFMQMINSIVPESSEPMAYIYYYILFLLVYSSLILFLCICSLCIYEKDTPVPQSIEKMIYCIRCWYFKRNKDKVTPERRTSILSEQVDVKSTNVKLSFSQYVDETPLVTWILVGKTFDSCCYILLLMTYLAMTIHTFVKLYLNYSF